MIHYRSLWRLLAALVVLLGAMAAYPAWAKHAAHSRHHHQALPHRSGGGEQHSKGRGVGTNNSPDSDVRANERNPQSKAGDETKRDTQVDANPEVKSRGPERHGGQQPASAASPIDTSITVVGPPKSKRLPWVHARSKAKLAKPPGERHGSHGISTRIAKGRVVRNAIGLSVRRTSGGQNEAHEKVLLPTVTRENSNVTVVGPGGRQGFVPLRASGGKSLNLPTSAAKNPAFINGRDMNRPSLGVGAIGGPGRRIVGGIISGSDFHPRHP